jgi:hypothetical protein
MPGRFASRHFEERSFVAALLRMTTRVEVARRSEVDGWGLGGRRARIQGRRLGRGGYVEEVGLEGVAADEEADVVKFFAGAIVADVV